MNARRLASTVMPPAVFGLVFLLAWEAVVKGFDLKPFFLPAPSAIWSAFADNADLVRRAAFVSGTNALVGLIAGTLLGIAMSFLLMRFNVLNELVSPLAVALNAIPIVVLVAVFQNMYPSTSELPRRLMVMLIVFFIVLTNVAKGLRQVHATHLELMRSYAASPVEILVKTRIPNALPYLFTALKIAAPTAVITAFVSEYFGGRQNGLGYFIPSNFASSRTEVAWAYVIGACLLGLVFYLVSIALENITIHRRGAAPGGATP
ncbi:MAG: ABC transporter permease [Ilumatobacter sp.]|uniref:ABC transporter permease n=1 Tax=Ilumatobacter sp. TaxID=1967498 RepID=UPI00261B5ED4|nr:ABC transporter permease [Ilumatobacter sp.]MDJ0770856.1 ABC transporter permease [Ilumatobacter sp.]